MSKKLLINVRPMGTRVALIENGELRDFKVERDSDGRSLVGSIFKGQVARVLPGMQAAFVDINLDRAGFLYVGDVRVDIDSGSPVLITNDIPNIAVENVFDHQELVEENKTPIQELLTQGQKILVQVAKDPLGTKGARITTHISLPGRYVVYMPTVNHVGISRKVSSEEERERLKEIVERFKPKHGGFIVRTAAEGAPAEALKADIDYLVRLYDEVYKSFNEKKTAGLIHAELDVELRTVRDWATEDIDEIIIDDNKTYEKIKKFVNQFIPQLQNKIYYYDKEIPIFDEYEVDYEVSRSLGRKVWLKSGGYIIIDEAEALVAIDVNTGSYVGKKDLEDTILNTNLEAVKEIAHQLRIRNCGGIIVLDLIDMEKELHREIVLKQLEEELSKDKARTNIVDFSPLGLVEMTRKRIRPSLVKTLCEPCKYCDGKGYIKKASTVANDIFRELEREGVNLQTTSSIIQCHSKVADWIYEECNEMLEYLEKKLSRSIIFKVELGVHVEHFKIITQ